MRTNMRFDIRRIIAVIYIITPTILICGPMFGGYLPLWIWPYILWLFTGSIWQIIFRIYVVTIAGILLFFKYRPCSFNALVAGLVLPSLFSIGFATRYMVTAMINRPPEPVSGAGLGYLLMLAIVIFTTLFYSLPFSAIAFAVRKDRLEKQEP